MKNSKILNGLCFLLALMMFNCKSPSNLLQEGDYEEAVYQAIKNLRKKKKKREKDIIVVEEAYRKITKIDMDQIAALKAEGQASKWVKINEIHNNIKDRQDLISPYLPLVANKTGYKADFRFVKIIPMELQSRRNAAEYYYVGGKKLLASASSGDKNAARNANRKFKKVKSYFSDYKDIDKLLAESYTIGVDKVLLEMRNSSFAIIPHGFENELLSFNENRLNEYWTTYYRNYNAPADIDFKVIIDITDIDVSPERFREEIYTVQNVIYETRRRRIDNRLSTGGGRTGSGSTIRDSTEQSPRPRYENIKVPITVSAEIFDIYQTKSANIRARISFYEAGSKQLLNAESVTATIDFENIATKFSGDRRAIKGAVRNRLGSIPVNFPTDSELVMNAASELKGEITKTIRNTDGYVFR